jgi:hypothetical protein
MWIEFLSSHKRVTHTKKQAVRACQRTWASSPRARALGTLTPPPGVQNRYCCNQPHVSDPPSPPEPG